MRRWKSISLRVRVHTILVTLVFVTMAGGLVTVWYTYRMEHLLATVTEKDLVAFQKAESLETALINQKGFLSYYFIEGNPEWLRQMEEFRRIFKERLSEALQLDGSDRETALLNQIETEYARYISNKDRVIAYYQEGKRDVGTALHRQVRFLFFSVLELCEAFKTVHRDRIRQVQADSQVEAGKLRVMAATGVLITLFLAVLLALVMWYQILGPVRRLTAEAAGESDAAPVNNEVTALSRSVHGLLQDADQTQVELQKSRESLLQAEKLALVGKLAAGMAHSIRNPFTSVKMRLFSLSRSLPLRDTQKEDFDVISEEIRHIDTIVQNFLEFSRPPKLILQAISPSVVVDHAIQLLEHRLKSYDVNLRVERQGNLPNISADPEQLKEVLVNLIVNACEAVEEDGHIVIEEQVTLTSANERVAVIQVRDNGSGMPESVREKILQPFFTTKEEGTGLGLSIVARIVEEHGGSVHVDSREGAGSTFSVALPILEGADGNDSDYR